jgi:HD-like signal output (HDOD) protein
MSSTNPARVVDLNQLLKGAQLPALPQSAIRLLELSQDPDNGPAEFAIPIELDPGLAGQVLRFVNSSYFGFSREISAVKQAITLVGIRTIKNFALWSAVFSLMPNPKCGPFDLKALWQDSLRRGLFARAIGRMLGMKDAEEVFAGALLQDMAVPLLAKELNRDYLDLLQKRNDGRRLHELERERFGWTHADAGGKLARIWNLPEGFAQLIENHTSLDAMLAAPTAQTGPLAVALSALLPSASDSVWHDGPNFDAACGKVLKAAPQGNLPEVLSQVDHQFTEFAPVMKLATPARSLVDCYNDLLAAAH